MLDHQGQWYRYPPFFVDVEHDLTSDRPLPFPDASVDRFYSEHTFEHFSDAVGARVFAEMRRCLALDGGVRIVVPDAALVWRKFGERDARFFARWMRLHDATLTEAFLILIGHPREPVDEQTMVFGGPVRSALELGLEQYDIFLERMEADPARAAEYCQEGAIARQRRDQARERIRPVILTLDRWGVSPQAVTYAGTVHPGNYLVLLGGDGGGDGGAGVTHGLPVSTTHIAVGAVIGVGLARGIGAIDVRVIGGIVMSWIVTLPVGGVLAALIFFTLKGIFT